MEAKESPCRKGREPGRGTLMEIESSKPSMMVDWDVASVKVLLGLVALDSLCSIQRCCPMGARR